MTHEDAGHYAAKHPGAEPDPELAAAVRALSRDGGLSCAEAHRIAQKLEVSPADVGRTLDLLEMRIRRCQLGLFGYHPQRKILQPADSVKPDLAEALEQAASQGRISCARLWQVAETGHMPRLSTAAACERLGLKIGPCQLGAF